MANIILRTADPFSFTPVGKTWVTSLINRREEICCRFARRYNYKRAKCEDPKLIQDWFTTLQDIQAEFGILDKDIFNFDKTGFAMGIIATIKVVTRANMPGKPYLIQPGQREWVTTIKYINLIGWSIPSTIIFKGKVYIEGWFGEYNLPRDWRIKLSTNGWTNNDIGLQWLKEVFLPATNTQKVG